MASKSTHKTSRLPEITPKVGMEVVSRGVIIGDVIHVQALMSGEMFLGIEGRPAKGARARNWYKDSELKALGFKLQSPSGKG